MKWLLLFLSTVAALAGSSVPLDRQINWSRENIGIEGGIPAVTEVYTNLFPSGGDDATQLLGAIYNCPSNKVINILGFLQVSGNIDWGFMKNWGQVLRGIGAHRSGIILNSGFIYVRNNGFAEEDLTNEVALVSDSLKGSTTITVGAVPAWLTVGDLLIIDSIANTNLVWGYGTSENENPAAGYRQIAIANFEGVQEGRGLGQIVKVVALGATTITTELPMNYDYLVADGAQIAKAYHNTAAIDPTVAQGPPARIGFEFLKFEQTFPSGSTDLFRVENARDIWWKGCIFTNSAGARHIQTAFSYRTEVRNSYIVDSQRYGGGQGYGVAWYHLTTASLVEDNIFNRLHNGVTGNYGANGNVAAYNVVLKGIADSGQSPSFGTHGVHCYMNLFEGNYCVDKILFDWSHGSGSHSVALRNRVLGYNGTRIIDAIPIINEFYNRSNTFTGNILGVEGFHTNTITYATNDYCDSLSRDIAHLGFFSFGCAYGPHNWDDATRGAAIWAVNYDVVTSTNNGIMLGGYQTNDVPVSLIYNSTPSWWPSGMPFPPYDPTMGDSASMTNLPAGVRYQSLTNVAASMIGILNTSRLIIE